MERPATRTLQEVIIAAHFDAPLPLTVVDAADWVRHFSADFPLVQQLPNLPRADLPVPGAQPQFQFMAVDSGELPRLLLRTGDSRHSVQLQADRFAYGWSRTEPPGQPADYPGFESFSEGWSAIVKHFDEWTKVRFKQVANHRLIELTYSNAALRQKDGKDRKLSEIFKFVQPGKRSLHGFNVSWIERVYDDPGMMQAIITSTVGLGMALPASPALIFNFVGLGTVAPGQESKHILNDIHRKIREIYESAIVADAD